MSVCVLEEMIDHDSSTIFFIYQNLKKLVQQLDQTKADKISVNNELDKVNEHLIDDDNDFSLQKADKRDLDHRVLKKDFHTACGELSQNINDCLQKFNVHVRHRSIALN